jgi:hypothetical protein
LYLRAPGFENRKFDKTISFDFRIRLTRKTEPKHEPKPPQPNAARHEMRPTDGDGMRNEDDQWAKKIALSR